MIFRSLTRRPRTLETDLTPLIDVIFLLLIFFLTTTQLAAKSQMALELPSERGERRGGGEEPGLIVNLRRDGALVVLDEEVSPAEVTRMARRMREGRLDARPVVRADRAAPAQSLNRLLSALREAGVEGITFAVAPER